VQVLDKRDEFLARDIGINKHDRRAPERRRRHGLISMLHLPDHMHVRALVKDRPQVTPTAVC
jgi:hypothetical protein